MTLVQLKDVGKTYGGRAILRGIDWSIEEKIRIGLIGPNGAGKSTICKIIGGLEENDTGEVTRTRGLVTAYLPQHIQPELRTPIEIVVRARTDIAAVERELADIAERMGSAEASADMAILERLLNQQERALEKLDQLGVAGLEGEARAKLTELGLRRDDQTKPLSQLSGGQRKMVHLVACLMTRPDLLLLDEPETHLDLKARARLEAIIRGFDGAAVIISHDRYLLDETVREIAQLEPNKLRVFHGNYSEYAVERELALKRQEVLYTTQQKEIARLEEAIRRFRQWASELPDSADNSRLIKQARNKQRQIDSMEKIERPVLERRKIALQLRNTNRGGQKVMELNGVTVKAESGQALLDHVGVLAHRGDRIGVIGANGSGKTVLIRTIMGELQPMNGSIWIGPSVRSGYFAQNPDPGRDESTPIDIIRDIRNMREDEAVSKLMKFLFSYEQTRQKVGKLSGGERSRLQLLALMLSEANLLVLDEPTNHLDIESMEVLEQALEEYQGTVIVVSHDRYFLDRIVDRTVEVDEGRLRESEGGYSNWAEMASA